MNRLLLLYVLFLVSCFPNKENREVVVDSSLESSWAAAKWHQDTLIELIYIPQACYCPVWMDYKAYKAVHGDVHIDTEILYDRIDIYKDGYFLTFPNAELADEFLVAGNRMKVICQVLDFKDTNFLKNSTKTRELMVSAFELQKPFKMKTREFVTIDQFGDSIFVDQINVIKD